MSIEHEAQRVVPQFPANFPLGNWQEIGGAILWASSSIDIATPKGVLELSRWVWFGLWVGLPRSPTGRAAIALAIHLNAERGLVPPEPASREN